MLHSVFRTLAVLLCFLGLTSGCSKVDSYKAKRALATANAQYQAEKYTAAAFNYEKTLRLIPMQPVAMRQLGLIYFKTGRLPRAYAYLKEAVKLEPENLEVRTSLGLIQLGFRDIKAAAEAANFVLSRQPTNEEAIMLLSETVTSAKAAAEMAEQFNNMIKVNGDQAVYRLGLSTLALKSGNLTNAMKEINRAYELAPNSVSVISALGAVAFLNKDVEKAGEYFKAAADLSPLRSPRRIKYAMFKLQYGGPEQAVPLLREMAEKAPDYIPAYTVLAQLAYNAKDFDECEKALKAILTRDDSNYEALLLKGNLKLAKGDAKGALEDFSRAAAFFKQSPQFMVGLAKAHLLAGEPGKAVSALNQALSLDPSSAEATLLLAELNFQKRDFTAATGALERLVKQQPKIRQAQLLLAAAYAAGENFQEALRVYQNMNQLWPRSPDVAYLAAGVFAKARDFGQARKAAAQALELAPEFFQAADLLVDLDLAEKKFADAHARASKLMSAKPKAVEPRMMEAKIFLAEQEHDKARESLLKTIEIAPESSQAYLWLTEIYKATGKQTEALAKLNDLVSRTNEIQAFMQIGFIQESLTNFAGACAAYEKVIQLNPKSAPALVNLAHNNLAYIYAEHLSQPDRALAHAEEARKMLPNLAEAIDTLGWVLYLKGDYGRALGLLQRAAAELADNAEVQFHFGMISYMMGEEVSALSALTRSLQTTNAMSYKAEANERLATLRLDAKTSSADALREVLKQKPKDTIALLKLAAVYEREGSFAEAARTYESLLKNIPQNPRILIKLARLYAGELRDGKKALTLAKEAHELLPGDAEVMKVLGRLVLEGGDTAWAASLLQSAARQSTGDLELQYLLGWALYLTGDLPESAEAMQASLKAGPAAPYFTDARQFVTFTEALPDPARANALGAQVAAALKTNSTYVPALMIAAKIDQTNGKGEEALKTYRSVLDKNPEFTPAARELTILAARNPDADPKVFDLGLKARTAYPTDAELARALGVLSYRRNDFPRAVQYLRESTLKNSKDAEALCYLGIAEFRQKSAKQAKTTLQQALSLGTLTAKLTEDAKKTLAEIR